MDRDEALMLLGVWPSPFVIRAGIALNLKSLSYIYAEEEDLFGNKSVILLCSNPVHKKSGRSMEERTDAVSQVAPVLETLEQALKQDCSKSKGKAPFFSRNGVGLVDVGLGRGFLGGCALPRGCAARRPSTTQDAVQHDRWRGRPRAPLHAAHLLPVVARLLVGTLPTSRSAVRASSTSPVPAAISAHSQQPSRPQPATPLHPARVASHGAVKSKN
ncbi:hypothetical protein PR202_ga07657 [Eleusine coracana subsp. coracana]|uniref:Glutathione S-transferase n=1 Tax=Eleusine coracana subsp. coracana TaxID=191504 RepID=A0AAV5C044_ELECO|nr:hypothetical protein PR202_ga07657 [Eleusine coracana subsp. coracana]